MKTKTRKLGTDFSFASFFKSPEGPVTLMLTDKGLILTQSYHILVLSLEGEGQLK